MNRLLLTPALITKYRYIIFIKLLIQQDFFFSIIAILDAFEMKGLRRMLRVSWTAKKTNGLDGQHQDVDRTLRGRVNQNDRGQG